MFYDIQKDTHILRTTYSISIFVLNQFYKFDRIGEETEIKVKKLMINVKAIERDQLKR